MAQCLLRLSTGCVVRNDAGSHSVSWCVKLSMSRGWVYTHVDFEPAISWVCADGLTEARNASGELLEEDRLDELVQASTASASTLVERVPARVADFSARADPNDD